MLNNAQPMTTYTTYDYIHNQGNRASDEQQYYPKKNLTTLHNTTNSCNNYKP